VKNDQTSGSTYDKLQWRSIFGYLLAESDLSGNITGEYIYFAGKRIARRDAASGNVYYFFQDHLESTRVIADQNGATVRESDYYAFGGERVVGTATVDDPHKFAGMYQDAESGQYYTWGRIYSPNLGRFLSPDPVAGSIGVPQSLNRYAYALNNPTNFADPLGLTWLCIITIECYYIIYPVPPHAFERIDLGCREIGRRCTELPDKDTQKKRDLIKAALAHENLSDCLHKWFGLGDILTNANLPRIDASQDLEGGALGQTRASMVPDTGRGTILIDRATFASHSATDHFTMVDTYLHETANALAIQRFTQYGYRPYRMLLGARGSIPTEHQLNSFPDQDIGKQFEECLHP